jgi:hypothetical protein
MRYHPSQWPFHTSFRRINMAYAMKRNAGRPKQRARRMAGKTSSHFAKGFALGKRVGKGSTQKMIRKSVFAYIRANGSAAEKRLGLTDNSDAAKDFRLGIRDAAAQLEGFNPSAGSDRNARIETAAYKGKAASKRKSSSSSRKRVKMPDGSFRYRVDGKFASKAAYDAAGGKSSSRKSSKRDVSSMSWGDLRKKAGARYRVGMTRVEVEEIVSSARSNPRKRTRSNPRKRLSRTRRNPRAKIAHPVGIYTRPAGSYLGQASDTHHPVFRSPVHKIELIWDLSDWETQSPTKYDPDKVLKRGGEYIFRGLQASPGGYDDPYMVEIPAGSTQAEAIGHILHALDNHYNAKNIRPVLLDELRMPPRRGDGVGEVGTRWEVAFPTGNEKIQHFANNNPRKRRARRRLLREYMVTYDNMGETDFAMIEAFNLTEAKAKAKYELMPAHDLEPDAVLSVRPGPGSAHLVRWGQKQAKAAKGKRDAKGRFTKRKNPRNFGAEFLFI